MSEYSTEKIIARTFMEMADSLENGGMINPAKIAVTGVGSEHGEENVLEGAIIARKKGINVVYIGTLTADGITTVKAQTPDEAHEIMEELLNSKEVDGVVTMHYPFPIGVSTVGRVPTPGKGREMYIATTTGTSSSKRTEGMILNAIYGISVAKACGVEEPTVGILNIDGARQVETALKKLQQNGYDIKFAESTRSDKGCVMRGNDLLSGGCDVMVCDPLTGNILMKTLSSFTTGGSYESTGYGYGPGIGENYDKLVMIVSRASGAPVIAGAIEYAAQLVNEEYQDVVTSEFAKANKVGLKGLLESKKEVKSDLPEQPPKEVVVHQIGGIEIMDLDDAVISLWKAGIYAESGMGCTGPIVLVSEAKAEIAENALRENGWIG